MMMPSIFGENLFDDFMDDFSFPTLPDVDKELYGKHAKNLMKLMLRKLMTDIRLQLIFQDLRRTKSRLNLKMVH